MKNIALIVVVLLSGCGVGAEYSGPKSVLKECKDFRDGEVFRFNTDTITNVMIGVGSPSHFDFVDTTGKQRTLSSDMQAFIKCYDVGAGGSK